jgi:hypothetical protein
MKNRCQDVTCQNSTLRIELFQQPDRPFFLYSVLLKRNAVCLQIQVFQSHMGHTAFCSQNLTL